MSQSQILIVKAKHFYKTHFGDVCRCALAKAARDQFGKYSTEWVDAIKIGDKTFSHRPFTKAVFDNMGALAYAAKFDDTVVGQIELTPTNTEFQYL